MISENLKHNFAAGWQDIQLNLGTVKPGTMVPFKFRYQARTVDGKEIELDCWEPIGCDCFHGQLKEDGFEGTVPIGTADSFMQDAQNLNTNMLVNERYLAVYADILGLLYTIDPVSLKATKNLEKPFVRLSFSYTVDLSDHFVPGTR